MTTQRIRYARAGDRLSASYVNQLVDGANLALQKLDGPRSKKTPETSSGAIDVDAQGTGEIEGVGTRVYTESNRETSTVRVTDPNDSEIYVDVDRIDEVTLESSEDSITLVFDNS